MGPAAQCMPNVIAQRRIVCAPNGVSRSSVGKHSEPNDGDELIALGEAPHLRLRDCPHACGLATICWSEQAIQLVFLEVQFGLAQEGA